MTGRKCNGSYTSYDLEGGGRWPQPCTNRCGCGYDGCPSIIDRRLQQQLEKNTYRPPIDLHAAVEKQLARLSFLGGSKGADALEDISDEECVELCEGTSADFTQGVRMHGKAAIFLNHWGWGRPHNRYSFSVFERSVEGWQEVGGRIDAIEEAIALLIRTLAEHDLRKGA
jgi:hypothetical protein